MKRFLVVFISFLFFTAGVQAQDGDRPGRERIHAAKMAYITDKLHLTTEQAAPFTAVYGEYEGEIKQLRKSYREKFMADKRNGSADDMTVRQYIDDNLDYQQGMLDIKKKYKDRFLKVISQKQLSDLHEAEREFKKLLIQRLNGEGGRGGMRRMR